MNMLSDKERKFVSAYTSRKKYDKALKQWTRLEFREVVESYNHTSDRVGVCVLLTGFENGDLWFYDEKKVI